MEKRRGVDSRGLAALAGVVALLVISLANWRTVQRIDRALGERLHDRLFANQEQLNLEAYRTYALELGLDLARFEKDLADFANAIDAELARLTLPAPPVR